MEEMSMIKKINELEQLVQNYREKFEEKSSKCDELENKNHILDAAITDLTKIIKDQKKELIDLRIVNKLGKDREITKKLRPNSKTRCKKFVCSYDGCNYFTDIQDDFDFHKNVHEMATLKCPYCMYLSFNPRDLRRHVTGSDKHCRFMYSCNYCKDVQPYVTNNEAHFRAHIQKHFRGAIDDNRMDFFIESIHSAAPMTVWTALNAMYKVHDIQDEEENLNSSKPGPKRKLETNKQPTTKIQKLVDGLSQEEFWSSIPESESRSNCEIFSETIVSGSPIVSEPVTNVVLNPATSLSIDDTIIMNSSVQIDDSKITKQSVESFDSQVLQKQIPENVQEIITEHSLPEPRVPMEMSGSLVNETQVITSQEESSNGESLIENTDALQQVLQFSNLNFPMGSDIIFYFPDENEDINSSDQVCVFQHISVQDGLTHVTLEPSILPESFIPKDAQVLPAEINTNPELVNVQLSNQ